MGYAEWYADLVDSGYSSEEAAAIVDLAVCEDALEKRLERTPTTKEVEREYERLVA